jgi:hypothetical protein
MAVEPSDRPGADLPQCRQFHSRLPIAKPSVVSLVVVSVLIALLSSCVLLDLRMLVIDVGSTA